jgi:rhamnosyltransferase
MWHKSSDSIQSKAYPEVSNSTVVRKEVMTQFTTPILVVLHIYHLNVLDDISQILHRINSPFDLYISTSLDLPAGLISKLGPRVGEKFIVNCDNRGRDWGPFVEMLSGFDYTKYEVILKIHTKNSAHRPDSKYVMREIFSGVYPVNDFDRYVLSFLRNHPHIDFISPSRVLIAGIERIGQNFTSIVNFLAPHNFQLNPRFNFIEGSIFWIRPSALNFLKAYNFRLSDFELEPIGYDGSLAHIVERLIFLEQGGARNRIIESLSIIQWKNGF